MKKQNLSTMKKGKIMIEYLSRREFIGKSALMAGGIAPAMVGLNVPHAAAARGRGRISGTHG